MNKKIIPIIVRLKENNNYIVQGIEQNDAGVIFDLQVNDGLEAFDFSGYSLVTLKIQKPDGTFTYDTTSDATLDTIDPTKGRLKVNIPTSCTAQNGMHFCTISFASDEKIIFETCSFNYFVGENPQAKDEDVIGTNEFPILTNLIAQVAGIISAEQTRLFEESERVDHETDRREIFASLIAIFMETLGLLEYMMKDAQGLIDEFNEAVAHGASVDISQIAQLATKAYVATALNSLDFGSLSGVKTKTLRILRGTQAQITSGDTDLSEGELAYATDTNELYIGGNNDTKAKLNESPFAVGSSAPSTSKLWIDTSGTSPQLKFYDQTTSTWKSCNTAVYA